MRLKCTSRRSTCTGRKSTSTRARCSRHATNEGRCAPHMCTGLTGNEPAFVTECDIK